MPSDSAMAHFQSIVMPLRNAERNYGARKAQELLSSDEFAPAFAKLVKLPPVDRLRALGIVSEIMGAPAPVQRKWKFPPPRRPIKWTELNKARFRKAWLQGGPAAGARALGISYEAAKLAAKRQGLTVAGATAKLARAA